MSYIFGDGFDCYATLNDAVAGYWDGGLLNFMTLTGGRFAGSQALAITGGGGSMYKNSPANDAMHHIVVAFRQTAALSGTTIAGYFQLTDGTTGQCSIAFRSDGAILLTSGGPGGTVLATYTGAVTAANTWYAFEFEVFISNTAGYMNVRKNGNTVNDFASATNLNTRTTANNYANRLLVGGNVTLNAQNFDDLLWRSDATSVPWIGDVRCYTRMPASDASVQFARSMSTQTFSFGVATTSSVAPGTSYYTAFTPTYDGTVGTIVLNINTGFTGNMKLSLFADNAGAPGAVLGSATTLINPVTGNNTFTFSTPVAVSRGVQYWFGISKDVTVTLNLGSAGANGRASISVTYAAFPTASPIVGGNQNVIPGTVTVTNVNNAAMVNEAQQDGTTSYVSDSTAGDADFYNIAGIVGTPASTIAVITRGFVEKSDAGTRTAAVQLKSGATTVQSTPATMGTNFGWMYRVDTVDPATSAAWTAVGVNNAQIGPVVVT